MIINLSPQLQSGDTILSVWKVGDVLIVDGVSLDFTQLPEGGTLPSGSVQSKWVFGDVSRVDGHVNIILTLPHSDNSSEARRFPKPIVMVEDGLVEFPQ